MSYSVNVDVAIVSDDDRWLLIVRGAEESHAAGQLSLVGGTLEVDGFASDVLEDTARREVLEEVGLHLTQPLEYVESTVFTADDGDRVLNVVFLARDVDVDAAVVASPDEIAALTVVTTAELDALDAPPWTRQSLERAASLKALTPGS